LRASKVGLGKRVLASPKISAIPITRTDGHNQLLLCDNLTVARTMGTNVSAVRMSLRKSP